MKVTTIELQKEYSFIEGGKLDCIITDCPLGDDPAWRRPAVIVVPGGGYGECSPREGEPIANAFLARGYQVFVLTYLCVGDGVRYPEQLLELSAAVDYVRKHAEEFSVNPQEVFAVGFSAGGHLVADLAVEHASVSEKAGTILDCKLTAVGLGYPVISKKHGHQGSYENLLNGYTEEAQEELLKTLNLDEAVDENTSPSFLWATAEDHAVPADNAIRFAYALANHNVPYELHIYPCGEHGLATGDRDVSCMDPVGSYTRRLANWLDDCAEFFRMFVKEEF